jgi:predicted naringenin-chalcone synthase
MSSATILYVLRDILATHHGLTCAMAFGPGLTVETALLERCDAA